MVSGVSAVEVTTNRKTGPVSVTWVAQQSCPKSCPWLRNGCYDESGPAGWVTAKLNRTKHNAQQLAAAEAKAIDGLSGQRPMRVHVVGDCATNRAARTVSLAVARYMDKFGEPAWTYCHAWRTVLRKSWGKVSVLASCETLQHCAAAMKRGYAASIVVPEHNGPKAWKAEGMTVIPCPEQTGKTQDCTTCRLCWDDKALLARHAVIAFAAHGQGKAKVKAQLIQIGRME